MKSFITITYRIETAGNIEALAAKIASDQSTGTFVPLAAETEELKNRVAARVVAIRNFTPAKTPSFPTDESGPFHRADVDIDGVESAGLDLGGWDRGHAGADDAYVDAGFD